jgi:hypothetical protein
MKKYLHICSQLSIVSLVTTGCSVLVNPDLTRLGSRDGAVAQDSANGSNDVEQRDAVVELDVPSVEVDVSPVCPDNCDDGVACTTDRCNGNMCVHTPDNGFCGPNLRCDPVMGCVPMMNRCQQPSDCDDRTPCTVDTCEMGGMCRHTPVDADRDGAPAMMVDGVACVGGTDCDDSRMNVNPMAMEICGDRIDNNCNGMIDDPALCMQMNNNTTCMTAARIDLTNTMMIDVTGDNRMGMDSVRGYCNDNNIGAGPELWYAVTWPANRDLVLEMSRNSDGVDPALYVTGSCGAAVAACNDDIAGADHNSRIILRAESGAAIGNRTVQVAADAFNNQNGAFRLRASTRAVINTSCASPYDIGAGATVRTASVNPMGGGPTLCGVAIAQDFYRVRSNNGRGSFSVSAGQVEQRWDCGAMGGRCAGNNGQFDTRGDTILGVDRFMGAVGGYTLSIKGP